MYLLLSKWEGADASKAVVVFYFRFKGNFALLKELQNMNTLLICLISNLTSLLIKYLHRQRQVTGKDYAL